MIEERQENRIKQEWTHRVSIKESRWSIMVKQLKKSIYFFNIKARYYSYKR
mgnify:CR=1 FL=1